jgi:hypothetical protein
MRQCVRPGVNKLSLCFLQLMSLTRGSIQIDGSCIFEPKFSSKCTLMKPVGPTLAGKVSCNPSQSSVHRPPPLPFRDSCRLQL